jgi:hypothetical protein
MSIDIYILYKKVYFQTKGQMSIQDSHKENCFK